MDTTLVFNTRKWVIFTFMGWVTGVILIILAGHQSLLGLYMGLGVGLLQWNYLRKFPGFGPAWLWTSVAGMGLPFLVIGLIPGNAIPFSMITSIALGTFCISILQFALLKRISGKARFWIISCMSGWLLGIGVVFLIDFTSRYKSDISVLLLALVNLVLILAGGVVLGYITGAGMKKILQTGSQGVPATGT